MDDRTPGQALPQRPARHCARQGTRGPTTVRRGMLLLLVLMTLMLAAAVITPLAALSGVEAVGTAHHAATLRHRLAAESVLAALPRLLRDDQQLQRDLDRHNRAKVTMTVGDVRVTALLQDDTAKLPLPLLFEIGGPRCAEQALTVLRDGAALSALELLPVLGGANHGGPSSLRWTGCLDDLFTAPTDAALFGTTRTTHAWAQYVTPLGNAVHVDRADVVVLEALLSDLRPGLGQRVAVARESQFDRSSIDELLATLELPEKVAREASRRLTCATRRYSLLIRTEIENDVRQRYVICAPPPHLRVLVNWEVAP